MSDTFCHVKNRPCYRDDCEPGKFCAMYDKPVTDTPADPIADEAREFAKRLHVLADDILAGRMTVARNYELYSELFNMARTLEHQKEAGRAEAMAWRPIEEAPENTTVDLWSPTLTRVPACRKRNGGWWDSSFYTRHITDATHFMPLPAPPAPQAATEKP